MWHFIHRIRCAAPASWLSRAGARPAPRLRRTLTYPFGVSRLTPTVATPEVRSTELYGCHSLRFAQCVVAEPRRGASSATPAADADVKCSSLRLAPCSSNLLSPLRRCVAPNGMAADKSLTCQRFIGAIPCRSSSTE